MNHLIPTPRTDKNGVTRIRHMKPSTATVPGKPVPVVVLPVSLDVAQEPVSEDIARLVYPGAETPREFEATVDLLREDNPGILSLVSDLLTTGNEIGKETVADIFKAALSTIDDIRSYTDDDDDWKNDAYEWLSPELEGKMTRAWVIANASDELGVEPGEPDFWDVYREAHQTHESHVLRTIKPQQTTSKVYWRGIVALLQSGVPMAHDHRDTSRFIQWAGEQEDLSAVIRITKERNTLDCGTLQAVMKEMEGKAALGNGVL